MNRTLSLLLVYGVVGCASSTDDDVNEVAQDISQALKDKCKKQPKKKCTVTTAIVGVEGGTVTTADGLTLDIPFGALDSDVTLTVTGTTFDPDPTIGGAGTVYAFEPEGTVFSRAVAVTLPLPSGMTAATVYWTKLGSTEFEPLRSTIAGSTITAETFHFSLAQVGAPVADPAIKGSAITTWITSNSLVVPPDPLPRNRFSEPSFTSLGDISVVVGDGNGGFTTLPAEPDDPDLPGKFQIKNVPTGGDYMLRIGQDYLITDAATVDLGVNAGGLPLSQRTELADDAQLDLTVDGIVGWNDGGGDPSVGDQLEFFSTEANLWRFQLDLAACTRQSPTDPCEPAPIASGATQAEALFDMSFMSGGFEAPQAVRTSEGHRAFMAQLRTVPSANGVLYQSMQRIGEFASLDQAVSGVTAASVTLDTDISTGNTIAVDYRGSQWKAKVQQYGNPNQYNCGQQGVCGAFVGVLAQAGMAEDGFYNANADLLLMYDLVGEDKNTGAMTYGSPAALGGQWGTLATVRWVTRVDYLLPGTSGLGFNSRVPQTSEWITTPDKLNNQIVTPKITAPRNVSIGGRPFYTGSATNLGNGALTITWDPPEIIPQIAPASGTGPNVPAPVRYTVAVRRLFPNGFNRTQGQRIASFTVFDQTSVTIPPDILTATDTYVFLVSAAAGTTREGSDTFVREPFRASLDIASANISSAIFGDAHGDAVAVDTLVGGLSHPMGLTITGSQLYWIEQGDEGGSNGRLWRSDLDGSNAVALVDGLASPKSVALDGNTLYWTNLGSFTSADASLMRIDITNCEPGNCPVTTLVVNSFFSNGNGLVVKNGDLFMAGGGAAVSVIRATDPCLAAPPCTPTEIGGYGYGLSVAADDVNVYWTDYGGPDQGTGQVLARPLDGSGAVTVIANGGSQTWDVHVQDGFVYYGNQAWYLPIPATIDRVPFDNADPSQHQNVATGRANGTDDPSSEIMKVFAIDATNVYYVGEYQYLMRASLDGSSGAVELGRLPTGGCPQGNMLVQGGALYWTDDCSGEILRYVLP